MTILILSVLLALTVEFSLYYKHCRKEPIFNISDKWDSGDLSSILPTVYSMKPTTDNDGLLSYCVSIKHGFKTKYRLFDSEISAQNFIGRECNE